MLKLCDTAIIMKFSTQSLGTGLHAIGQLFHATFDMPNTQAFHMPDQGKQRWRGLRQATDIGGIAGEKLCQPRLGKPARERLGQRPQRIHPHNCGGRSQHHRNHLTQRRRCRLHHRIIELLKQILRITRKAVKLSRRRRAKTVTHIFQTGLAIAHEVQARAVAPKMTGQDVFLYQRSVISQLAANLAKKRLKHRFHG